MIFINYFCKYISLYFLHDFDIAMTELIDILRVSESRVVIIFIQTKRNIFHVVIEF